MIVRWHKIAFLCFLGLAAGPASANIKLGTPAPDFMIKTLSGQVETPASLRGKTVILTFWATWCAPCREEMAAFEAYYEKHHADGLEIVAIDQDDPDNRPKVKAIMSAFTFTGALDAQSSHDKYGRVSELPVSIVIDRMGVVRADSRQGGWVFDGQRLDQVVTPLLAK